MIGDATKARERLGWQPAVRFNELIQLMVDADLEAVRQELAHPVRGAQTLTPAS